MIANPAMLAAVLSDPTRVNALAKTDIPELLGALEVVRARLMLRLQAPETAPQSREALLTAEQVAEQLGMSLQRVYELCRTGKLPCVKIGRQVRVAPTALDSFIQRGLL